VLCQPGVGLDHHARAFLALAVAVRYEAELDAPFLAPARLLLDAAAAAAAAALGSALRLAYTLCASAPELLAGTDLRVENDTLRLRLSGSGAYAGDSVLRRLEALSLALGLEAAVA
jgi:exopolyphosphatase/guanosine-5'-triphosphate,3'-diphosphate pyrophosphatase